MRELFRLFIPRVAKSDCARKLLYVGFISGQVMPTSIGTCTVISLDVSFFFRGSKLRRLFRIKTDRHDFVLFANVERDLSERAQLPVQNLRAQHGTSIVDQREHDRLPFEKLRQSHIAPGFIFENRIERNLII